MVNRLGEKAKNLGSEVKFLAKTKHYLPLWPAKAAVRSSLPIPIND